MAKGSTEERNWGILNINVTTSLGKFKGDLKDDLDVDVDQLSDSFIDQPAKYAWWAVLSAQANSIVDRARNELDNHKRWMKETLLGVLDVQVRERLELDGEKITESKVEKAIYAKKEYQEAVSKLTDLQEKVLKANEDAGLLEAARKAMEQRKDMLISLGAQLRSEQSDLELSMKKERAREVVKSNKKK